MTIILTKALAALCLLFGIWGVTTEATLGFDWKLFVGALLLGFFVHLVWRKETPRG